MEEKKWNLEDIETALWHIVKQTEIRQIQDFCEPSPTPYCITPCDKDIKIKDRPDLDELVELFKSTISAIDSE